ncbi:hypothetical protein CU098_006390 [Rhizopus stolonifer]|uniref:Uncharacterized protein n=1 Tax=Rhizopus stolonifer TaxID=4846 RepID=A0A367KN20_RHIST|nr:hypothetical protein CU098_006390 [Rhizopus stolonifer]
MTYLIGGRSLQGVEIDQEEKHQDASDDYLSKSQGSSFSYLSSSSYSCSYLSSQSDKNDHTLMLRRQQLTSQVFIEQLTKVNFPQRVKTLDASRNYITELPLQLFYFKNITHLIMSCNSLTHIPPVIYKHLKHLQHLILSENEIESISKEMPLYLQELTTLILDGNRVQLLPNTINQWKKLRELRLGSEYGGNRIRCLPSLSEMHALVDLDISFNQIDTLLPGTFIGLTRLRNLNLSNNQLVHMPDSHLFQDCEALVTLDLSNNQLVKIPNHIVSDLDDLIRSHHLQLLDLSDNQLSVLSEELLDQSRQVHVILKGNPLTLYPYHQQDRNSESSRAFNQQVHTMLQAVNPVSTYIDIFQTFDLTTALQQDEQEESQNEEISDDSAPVLLYSLREIALRMLLSSNDYHTGSLLVPEHIQYDIHNKQKLCFYCQQPFFNEWINSVRLKTYHGYPSVMQQIKFCSYQCWHHYRDRLAQQALATQSQIQTQTLEYMEQHEHILEPGSFDWIMAAVMAASLQQEHADIIANQI